MKNTAADDGFIPEEPEGRRAAVRIAEALDQERQPAATDTAWSRLNDLHRRQREAATLVTRHLIETLRAMYPAACAVVLAKRHGEFTCTRLVGIGGRTLSEFGLRTTHLPSVPARLREYWPAGAFASIGDMDGVIATLHACGIGFDDLPAGLRKGAADQHYTPALLLTENQSCEYGCH